MPDFSPGPEQAPDPSFRLPDLHTPAGVLLAVHYMATARGVPLLTPAGMLVAPLLAEALVEAAQGLADGPPFPGSDGLRPYWEARCRRLWLGGRLLKRFRQPAPLQTAILAAFQARGWAVAHLPDPLPDLPAASAEQAVARLQDTARNLNRGLPAAGLRFSAGPDGVWWEARGADTDG